MKKIKKRVLSLAQKAERALKKAVRNVVEEHRQTGEPLLVWKNDRVVKMPPSRLLHK